ncbi:MAG: STAS/SEC14 domain-containing protein [Candidatus Parcubacteria bacterium]|nr:STAS/SEC14 domain-containing protein [Burkholderiales bacterium]
MSNQISQATEDGVVHARISGMMTLADQQALEAFAKKLIEAGQVVRVLVTLEAFEGWEKNEAWGDDLEFQLEYGDKIIRIAIVGDERWQQQALLFVGKGFRDTTIEFFPTAALKDAQTWIGS